MTVCNIKELKISSLIDYAAFVLIYVISAFLSENRLSQFHLMAKKMCKLFMMLFKTFLIRFRIIEYTVFNIYKNIFVSKVQWISFIAQNNVFILKHFQFSAGNKRENWEIASKECTLLLRFTSQNWASCKQMKKNFVLESSLKVSEKCALVQIFQDFVGF